MSAAAREILHHLASLGAMVDRQGNKLILRAGSAPVPRNVLATIRLHKAEVLQALPVNGQRREDFGERAAIIEQDGHILREWAEGFARLDPDQPPGDVPPRRWQQFVDDVGRFLDSGFADRAAALGWGPFDLFGCDAVTVPSAGSISKVCVG